MQALREPTGDPVCKRFDGRENPLVKLEQINVDFVFKQILDAITLRQEISHADKTRDANKLYELVQMFPQHRANKYVRILDQSNCPQVVHTKFYTRNNGDPLLNQDNHLVSLLYVKWHKAVEEGLNLQHQEQWEAAQNELMTDTQFYRFLRPFQICTSICGIKERRSECYSRNENWECYRNRGLEPNKLLEFVISIWREEVSGKKMSTKIKTQLEEIMGD